MTTENKKLRLSHSAIDKFKTCGQMFNLHYNERIREDAIGSPLFFGSALDKAVTILLLRKKPNATKEEIEQSKLDPKQVFDKAFNFITLNNANISIPLSTKVYYSKADFDIRLLDNEDLKKVKSLDLVEINLPKTIKDIGEFYDEYSKIESPIEEEKILFNYINWLSLYKKGILILEAYEKDIIPNIVRVIDVQTTINLENDQGDRITGFIDFIAEWKDEGVIIFDNKTSAREYTKESVKESQQLMLYGEDQSHFKGGFIVMLKNLKMKKERICKKPDCLHSNTTGKHSCEKCGNKDMIISTTPEVKIQVIIDTFEVDKQEELFDNIQKVADEIKSESFTHNWDACFNYGRKCAYFNYCREGKMDGLVKLEDKE